MNPFEYAQPDTEQAALELLAEPGKSTAVLAGGTDLIPLMKRGVVSPDRVVNIREIDALKAIETDDRGNVWVGAAVSLAQFANDSGTDLLPAANQVIHNLGSIQVQAQTTVVGELLHRPRCWYFRRGHGLLADQGRKVIEGDSRYHAILGNRGPAKFVSASRLAPSLIAMGARLRVLGPRREDECWIELAQLYRTPGADDDLEITLRPGQWVTHLVIPPVGECLTAAYEVRHGEGPDPPLAAAAVSLRLERGLVRDAQIILGQVAPRPWSATRAAEALCGQPLNEHTVAVAGSEAVAGAVPLPDNKYKIQLASVAVRRALLIAAGRETGGLDGPMIRPADDPPPQLKLA